MCESISKYILDKRFYINIDKQRQQGAQGAQGSRGPIGAQGAQGSTGPIGLTGTPYGLFFYTNGTTVPAAPVPTYNAAGNPATIDYIYLKFPNYTSFGNNWIPTYSGAGVPTRLNIPLKGLYSISFFGCNQSIFNNNFEFFISRNSNNSFDLNEISSAMNLLSASSSRQTTVSVTTVLNAGDYINFGMFAPSNYTSFGRESAFINLIQRF